MEPLQLEDPRLVLREGATGYEFRSKAYETSLNLVYHYFIKWDDIGMLEAAPERHFVPSESKVLE